MLSSLLMAAAALTAVEVSQNPVQVSAAVPGSWVRACRNELPGCHSAALMKRQAGNVCAVGGCTSPVRLSSLACKACEILFLISTLSHYQPDQWCRDKRFHASGLVPVVCSIYPSDGGECGCVWGKTPVWLIDWFVGSWGQQQPVPEPCKASPDSWDAGTSEWARDPESVWPPTAMQRGLCRVSDKNGMSSPRIWVGGKAASCLWPGTAKRKAAQ